MLFSSPEFYLFFVAYLFCHLLFPRRLLLPLVVLGSSVFYGYCDYRLLWVPYLLVGLAWAGATAVSRVEGDRGRKTCLALAVAALLLPLAYFKYTNFLFLQIAAPLLGVSHAPLDLPLPLGISFITFTAIAHVVDVYREGPESDCGIGLLAGHILFFPKLIAGPMVRTRELAGQLGNLARAGADAIWLGLGYFTLGLVKKMIFADQLGVTVDSIYSHGPGLQGWDYLLAVFGYSAQIYCDFSGYTDMAIGLALMLGVDLPDNFRRPYLAHSVADFWRRWHITLSNWIRDYLYIPLGGNRCSAPRQMANVLMAMTLCGLWHGADWSFAIWGFVHGLAIVYSHVVKRMNLNAGWRLPQEVRQLVTFVFVSLAWVLFKSPNVGKAWEMFQQLALASYSGAAGWVGANSMPLLLLAIFFLSHFFDRRETVQALAGKANRMAYCGVLLTLWTMVLAFGAQSSQRFIYFDF